MIFCQDPGFPHKTQDFLDKCKEAEIDVMWGPELLTGKWQPFDAGLGRLLRLLVLGKCGLDQFLEKPANRRRWCSGKVTLQQKRLLALGWVSKAWTMLHESAEYERAHWHAWMRTGAMITLNGSEDVHIAPQGLHSYECPAADGAPAADAGHPDDID